MNDTPSRLPLNRIVLVLLLVAFAVIWFTPLGMRHLIPSDEGRYAEMAREMFVTGDWITPRYNGYKYFEKPPLQTWLNALTFAWFGIGEWQARLYTALASFAGVLLVGFTGARLFNPLSGFLAAVVLACSPYWNLMGHFNALDMGLAFWMALSLCALLLAQRPGLRPAAVRGWMWVCWAAMAFAVLSKGLVGVILPGAVLVLYTLIARDWALWKRLYLVSGLVIFFAIATPWFVLVQQRNPEFFNFFFIVQQFRRYLTPEQNRPGPFYYFVPVLLVGFLPWLSVAWQSVRHALRMPRQPNGFSPMLVLLIWSAFIFLFFSASHSKLISYVLPVAPALALIIGAYLPLLGADRFRRHLLGYLVFFVAAAFGIIFLAYQGDARTPNALYRAFQIWLYVGLAIAAVLTLVAAWLNRRAGVTAALAAFGAAWLIFGTIGGTGHDEFGRYSSGALLAPAVRAELAKLPPDTPFYSIEMLDHTFPFYVGHTTIMVHRQDELAFGISVEPNKWVPTVDEWIARWKQDTHALAIMPPGEYDALVKQQVPMRVIARDNRRVIVEKPQS
ncbi:glycosyltransferase family 39 protein [Burkholderia multivorans]|uniref:Dolichyl-phosphate-mannose-protein mannosyltransferase family protein n=1 Tax=Burkholderia multivorans CGD2 TaxID=513052 RepID=B9BYE4_9BURK|nr:glycosyltransferase family 39 protein [Burkholderia multivorans]EEE04238.1 dolichyl-phosphate-mannose-protein mannosyltransferase family protein [Burkholderia multivorans CGD2]EEE14461.1 dolichyl-phosphate-mannose-protein mannosyltransferase family protein [Burkholderia multivorans CGD2M]KPJ32166.1 4-amino-4-deoxy-L-arabinose transferase [Burkholderia multivorans]MBU9209828.1 glycosyltransferase family 39 protein [Burkholderia multivorans]MBU9316093.1 glycosyltransferase family 39 protein [